MDMQRYMDPSLTAGERARDLLLRMSLDEKFAQVQCLFPHEGAEDTYAETVRYGIGEVSTLEMRTLPDLRTASVWQRDFQRQIMENSPHHIPAIFHMEGLCGAYLHGAASFPGGLNRGSSWDPDLEKKIGQAVARAELSAGITHILAPVLDVSRDSRMGRQGETYGEDPTLAAKMGASFTEGIQETQCGGRHAESIAKHFLGFHDPQGGIHGANCDIPKRELREVFAKPFEAAIRKAHLRGIMPCYCTIDGEPVSSSREILTDMLRGEMGFDGVCLSDYGAVSNIHDVQHVGESLAEAGEMAMEAGMDVEAQMPVSFNEELKERFRSGEADMAVLDQAVLRVLEAKFRMGLFEHPYAMDEAEMRAAVVRDEDRELSRQSALESMVLIKNDGVLPLGSVDTASRAIRTADGHPVRKIAVVGCHAKNARIFFGGYTHVSMVEATRTAANSIAGLKAGSIDPALVKMVPGTQIESDEQEKFDEILRDLHPDCPSLLEELRRRLPGTEIVYAYGYPVAGADESGFEEALEVCADADLVILTLGGKNGSCSVASMGEGVDAVDISLPACQDSFIRKAAKLGKRMIGVHFNGRPISSDAADECLDAVLEAFSPSESGADAIVSVLLGEYNPGGKLTVSTARCAGQIPIYYNHPWGSAWHQGASIGFPNYVDCPHTPRYPFGHGLSYTTFEYSGLKIAGEGHQGQDTISECVDTERIGKVREQAVRIHPHGSILISFDVKNAGSMDGDEVVQLYLSDEHASCARPVKELAGFARIRLKAGECRQLTFRLNADQTAFLDRTMKWKVEKGRIAIQVGSSSEDIRLSGSFDIGEDAWIDGKSRSFWAETL